MTPTRIRLRDGGLHFVNAPRADVERAIKRARARGMQVVNLIDAGNGLLPLKDIAEVLPPAEPRKRRTWPTS